MADVLSRRALNRALLARQHLLDRPARQAGQVVARLIGVQAQQARPPFVALWTRMNECDRAGLAALIHRRQLVRATAMRSTLHLMTAADYLAFRGVLQPALSAGMKSILRDRGEAFDLAAVVETARRVFAAAPRTFTSLREALVGAFPDSEERAMGYAVRTHLPLISVPDDSPWAYRADTDFALAEAWLGAPVDAGVQTGQLVMRYLEGYGPATVADFQTWSALGGMKPVFESLRPKLRVFRDERKRELFDVPAAPMPAEDTPVPVRFLADFDNAILAHADRGRIIAEEYRPRVVTKNLLVLATFLVDGFVAGTWKTVREKQAARLDITPFAKLAPAVKAELAAEGERLLRFVEPEASSHKVAFA